MVLQPYKVYSRNADKPPIPNLLGVRKASNANFQSYLLSASFLAATGKSFVFTREPNRHGDRWTSCRFLRAISDTQNLSRNCFALCVELLLSPISIETTIRKTDVFGKCRHNNEKKKVWSTGENLEPIEHSTLLRPEPWKSAWCIFWMCVILKNE